MLLIRMLKLNMIAYALNAILLPWGSALSKYPGYVTIITTILLPLSTMNKELRFNLYQEKKAFFYLCVVVISALIVGLADTNIDQDFILAILGFTSLYATLSIETNTCTERDLRQLFAINKCLSLVYIIYAFGPFSFKYSSYDEWGNTWFTLGFSNPNTTGAYVMFCVAILVIEITYENKWGHKAINLLLITGLIYVIYMTESRTALICSCLFLLAMLLKCIPLRAWYADIVLILMMAFIGIQIWAASQGDATFLGKSVASGRQDMYTIFIQEIIDNPWRFIIGSVGTYRLENAHNVAFAVVRNFGFLGLIYFIAFWKSMIKSCVSSITCSVNRMAIWVLLIYIIYSSTEAASLIGMIPHGTPVLIIGRLAKDRFQKENINFTLS
jgi:hypothetical protein